MGNWEWMAGGAPGRQWQPEVGYDAMQVCLNGHIITDGAERNPAHTKPFCPQCGEKTIMACSACNTPIQGRLKAAISPKPIPVTNNCHQCGSPFPWRQQALDAAVEAVQLRLDEVDAAEAAGLVSVISTDNPRTEIAALKLRKLLGKVSKPIYDVAIKVIGDVAATTAKSHLGL